MRPWFGLQFLLWQVHDFSVVTLSAKTRGYVEDRSQKKPEPEVNTLNPSVSFNKNIFSTGGIINLCNELYKRSARGFTIKFVGGKAPHKESKR